MIATDAISLAAVAWLTFDELRLHVGLALDVRRLERNAVNASGLATDEPARSSWSMPTSSIFHPAPAAGDLPAGRLASRGTGSVGLEGTPAATEPPAWQGTPGDVQPQTPRV